MDFATVHQAFLASAARWPDHPLLVVPASPDRGYHAEGLTIGYGEAVRRVEALRNRYEKAGYGHGHRIALLLENRPEHFLHLLALNALGASIVPINPDYRPDEIRYLLEHSEADLVLSVSARVADLSEVALSVDPAPAVVDAEASAEGGDGSPRADDTPTRGGPGASHPRGPAESDAPIPSARRPPRPGTPGRDTEAALLYTSGTTARPKGCILSNDYHFAVGETYLGYGGMATLRPGQERVYNPLPLFHMNAGIFSFMGMLLTGGCVIIPDRFHPRTFWSDLERTEATILHYLGVIPPILLKQPPMPEERRHRIRFAAGAGVEPELHGPFESRFGFPLLELWGMTETGGSFMAAEEPRGIDTRAFGRPERDMQARIVDDADNEVPRGTPGELTVRRTGPNPRRGFFTAYLKNPEATSEAWRGGWFHTGDIVRQDESGMLHFVDRKKNIIRRSGENIAAAEIEATLLVDERVVQAAVIAVPDALRDEEVLACIVPVPGASPGPELAEALFELCMTRLAYYKAPGWFVFLSGIPTTGTHKIQKGNLFASGEDPRAHPTAVDLRDRKKRTRSR